MKYQFIFVIFLQCLFSHVYSQPKVAIEGSIVLGDDLSVAPLPGTIRFNGSDFQGWDGDTWISLSVGNVVEPSIDGSGNSYPSLQIGSQVWMSQNLNTAELNDGTPILKEEDGSNWSGLDVPAYCYYQNGDEQGDVYGALYNWYAVESGKLCPSGWRVPSLEDWSILFNYLGITIAGGSLREAGEEHWRTPNVGATNSSGFTGLPAGFRHNLGTYHSLTEWTYWWSMDPDPIVASNAWYVTTGYGGSGIGPVSKPKARGNSVRCIAE